MFSAHKSLSINFHANQHMQVSVSHIPGKGTAMTRDMHIASLLEAKQDNMRVLCRLHVHTTSLCNKLKRLRPRYLQDPISSCCLISRGRACLFAAD